MRRMMNYYNENDSKAASWLKQLIEARLIPQGKIDERSIAAVEPADLVGFTQCHFFAGIGGWPLALQLAGWPASRKVWTGSCPCQPYSDAGKQAGDDDERNLWPEMFRIIKGFEPKPFTIFGEQVEAAIRFGWLDGISTDLEGEGYSVGAVVLGAHSVGAPHIRQRLYWLAHSQLQRTGEGKQGQQRQEGKRGHRSAKHSSVSGLAVAGGPECRRGAESIGEHGQPFHIADRSEVIGVGVTIQPGLEGYAGHGNNGNESERYAAETVGPATQAGNTMWDRSKWHRCQDGKSRRIPIEPALFPLADGIPGRVGLLRGAGNAIVPQVAAEFIKAYMQEVGIAAQAILAT